MKSKLFACAIVLGIAIAILPACKSLVSLRYGMKKPAPETPESLTAFLVKNKYPDRNIFVLKDSAIFLRFMGDTSLNRYFLSHMIFDRNGRLFAFDTAHCQWYGAAVIRTLRPDSSYRTTPALTLGELLDRITPISAPEAADTVRNPDFTIVITWAKFIGRYNYRLFDLDTVAPADKAVRIRKIWLNVDLQEGWKCPLTAGNGKP